MASRSTLRTKQRRSKRDCSIAASAMPRRSTRSSRVARNRGQRSTVAWRTFVSSSEATSNDEPGAAATLSTLYVVALTAGMRIDTLLGDSPAYAGRSVQTNVDGSSMLGEQAGHDVDAAA